MVAGTSVVVGEVPTTVKVETSTITLANVVGSTTLLETTTEVNRDTTVLVDVSGVFRLVEVYTVVEVDVPVVVNDTAVVVGGLVEVNVRVREVVMTVDFVTLSVVVWGLKVTLLVRFLVDWAVVVK